MSIEFSYNSKYLTKNQKPWFPIMGEIHYSRVNEAEWKESLYKMKALGVDVVSSYAFWIHHEEIPGEYDFLGNKNLRRFVETIKETGLLMFLRVGPWCHGEVRNGGFPDWLKSVVKQERVNDPTYFAEVERYYRKLYEQVEGLLYKDGGPIIGLQIENEYGHCGGLQGEEGEEHMRTLTRMAKEIGFQVPYYTATGWGGAVTGGLIPVMGGYCDAPWDQRMTPIEPSGNYIFTHERNDHNIGSDHGFGAGITFDIDRFPFLTAELGGGLQVTHHRRPIASGKDISAMTLAKMGSGVNLLGYYMYHGGSNPKGKLTSLQESRATGYLNDYQEINYDFQAAIRQYGQVSDTGLELKLWATFIKDFGSEFCEMPAHIPADNPLYPTNHSDLRYSFRHNSHSGYLFVNNYQKNYNMAAHDNVEIRLELEHETLEFPRFSVQNRDFFFYPFNMNLGEAILKVATATPLCKIEQDGTYYFFYTDHEAKYQIQGDLDKNKIITLTREEALHAWKVRIDKEYLIISDAVILEQKEGISCRYHKDLELKVYPAFDTAPKDFTEVERTDSYGIYHYNVRLNEEVTIEVHNLAEGIVELELSYPEEMHNAILSFAYEGDQAKLYVGDEVIADHFFFGPNWEVGLKEFAYPKKLRLEILPLYDTDQVYLEVSPRYEDHKVVRFDQVKGRIEKSVQLTWK